MIGVRRQSEQDTTALGLTQEEGVGRAVAGTAGANWAWVGAAAPPDVAVPLTCKVELLALRRQVQVSSLASAVTLQLARDLDGQLPAHLVGSETPQGSPHPALQPWHGLERRPVSTGQCDATSTGPSLRSRTPEAPETHHLLWLHAVVDTSAARRNPETRHSAHTWGPHITWRRNTYIPYIQKKRATPAASAISGCI